MIDITIATNGTPAAAAYPVNQGRAMSISRLRGEVDVATGAGVTFGTAAISGALFGAVIGAGKRTGAPFAATTWGIPAWSPPI